MNDPFASFVWISHVHAYVHPKAHQQTQQVALWLVSRVPCRGVGCDVTLWFSLGPECALQSITPDQHSTMFLLVESDQCEAAEGHDAVWHMTGCFVSRLSLASSVPSYHFCHFVLAETVFANSVVKAQLLLFAHLLTRLSRSLVLSLSTVGASRKCWKPILCQKHL